MSYIGYAGKFDVGKRMVEGTGEDEDGRRYRGG
jgi:hypothetical protein